MTESLLILKNITFGNLLKVETSQNRPNMATCNDDVVYAHSWKLVCTMIAICDDGGVGEDKACSKVRVVVADGVALFVSVVVVADEARRFTAAFVG